MRSVRDEEANGRGKEGGLECRKDVRFGPFVVSCARRSRVVIMPSIERKHAAGGPRNQGHHLLDCFSARLLCAACPEIGGRISNFGRRFEGGLHWPMGRSKSGMLRSQRSPPIVNFFHLRSFASVAPKCRKSARVPVGGKGAGFPTSSRVPLDCFLLVEHPPCVHLPEVSFTVLVCVILCFDTRVGCFRLHGHFVHLFLLIESIHLCSLFVRRRRCSFDFLLLFQHAKNGAAVWRGRNSHLIVDPRGTSTSNRIGGDMPEVGSSHSLNHFL